MVAVTEDLFCMFRESERDIHKTIIRMEGKLVEIYQSISYLFIIADI